MAGKIFQMEVSQVPYSSVVGSALKIVDKKRGVVAMLMISVPQPSFDYKTVADAVTKAILNGHVSHSGVTLVLPDDFGSK